MSIDLDCQGRTTAPLEVDWDETDVMAYALGVGAGQDPSEELQLTTENSEAVTLEALSTYALVLAQRSTREMGTFGDYDPALAVHGRQTLVAHRPLPVRGRATIVTTVTGLYDKGSSAIVVTESTATDPAGDELFCAQRTVIVRGEGGFGGGRGPAQSWSVPAAAPDRVSLLKVRPEQALLYRLSGDRNPLHSDPVYARRGGFATPMLHGLCTLGFAERALIDSRSASPHGRLEMIDGRFRAPVWPGDELAVLIWQIDRGLGFEARSGRGTTVIDMGRARVADHPASDQQVSPS